MCYVQEILKVISKGFNDVIIGMQLFEFFFLEENGYDFDEGFFDEWNEFFLDDDLFEMIVDNLFFF